MSTVVLRSIAWDNCFSFGEGNVVDLSEEKVTQIIAPNGYGKSSIPLILEEALYNNNSKGVKKADIANRILGKPYSIHIPFSIDKNTYDVYINRSGASVKVKLIENGIDISEHTATGTFKVIKELIGIDFKTFQQLVYQSTTSSLQFLTATDTTRKKFLIDLFDLSRYTELFEIFKKAVADLNSEVNRLEGKISTLSEWLEENSKIDTTKEQLLDVPEIPDYYEEKSKLSKELEVIESTNDKIERNRKLKESLDSIKISEIVEKLKEIEEKPYDDLQKELGELDANSKNCLLLLQKIEKLKEDKCPTCLQDVDIEFKNSLIKENKELLKEYSSKITLLENEINDIKKNNILFQSLTKSLNEYTELSEKIDDTLPSNLLDVSKVSQELKDIENTIKTLQSEIKNIEKENNKIKAHNAKIDVYLEQNKSREKELLAVNTELNSLSDKLNQLEILKTTFSTNGLVAYKLENLVKDLEVYTNKFLAELSDGRFTIEFSLSKDKLNVILTDDGKEISISSPSSGEMARINISTLLAIRKLMSSISKNTINTLFLDEVISVLDDYGRERLVETLLEEEGLNTFLVSHSWTHPLVKKLEIKKTEGISWISDE